MDKIQPIGYLLIDDGIIKIDYDNIILSNSDDIDDTGECIYRLSSQSMDFSIDDNKDSINKRMNFEIVGIVLNVVRYLEKNRIPGKMILLFELITELWDSRILCEVHKR